MDLAVLILLNLVFLVIFYILFSIQMGRAIEKSRKSGIPREFYQNVEMIIQYLDTTLESVNQKNDALYKMLLRAETLKGELEALLERSERGGRAKGKKAAPAIQKPAAPAEPMAESTAAARPSTGNSAMERLLQQAGADQVEWTRSKDDLPALIGARANRPSPGSRPAPEGGASLNGVFAGIGRLARRVIGGTAPSRDEDENSPMQGPGTGTTAVPPAPTVSFEQQLYGYVPARGVRTSSRPNSKEAAREMDASPEHLRSSAEEQTEVDEAYFPDGLSEQRREKVEPFIDAAGDRATATNASAAGGQPLPEVPDLSRAGDRTAFVRALLRRGLGIDEIAATTGISYQEIELIEKIMQTGAVPGVRGSRRSTNRERRGM